MRYVQFTLLREGSSDNGLVPHLESLLVREGADEVVGDVVEWGGPTEEKLRQLVERGAGQDLIFIHRDADRAGFRAREQEVFAAAANCESCPPVIPLVPVRMTEAWLLVDEAQIRNVAGNPRAGHRLDMPPISGVENVADAKARLQALIAEASHLSGSALRELNSRFEANRAVLLNRLDIDGPVTQLPSWQRLVDDVRLFIARTPRTAVE